jgi:peptidoglycan hydrolase FlgJ
MQISALQPKIDPSHLPLESLAGNKVLTEDQKIGEASRQFEAVLLRQFLAESQKPVIKSELTDESTAAGIYQDMITNQLADSLSRGGGIGLAKSFERQLSHPAAIAAQASRLYVPKPAAADPETHRQDARATQ